MNETPEKIRKRKFDRVIGITILVAVVLFVGRFYLQKIPGYREVEARYAAKLRIPQTWEQVASALKLDDGGKAAREFQRKRAMRLERGRRPSFDLDIPLGGVKESEPEYEVTPLLDKEYFHVLRREIGRAKESIYVAMFVISREQSAADPVTAILNDLINARRRGVDIKVVVEHPRRSSDSLYRNNEEAIEYLVAGGVEAAFNEPQKQLHDKFVLIDREILLVGNHNWSQQALTVNREVSALVRARPPDPAFVRHFADIKLARPEETELGREGLIKDLQEELLHRGEGE